MFFHFICTLLTGLPDGSHSRAAVNGPPGLSGAGLVFLRDGGLWGLCFAICMSRLLLIPFAQYLQGDDGPRYLLEAVNLHAFGVFSHVAGGLPTPTAHDVPLYPLLLSGLIAIFHKLTYVCEVAAGLNAIFFTAAAVGLYGLARLFTARKQIAVTAVIVFALFPETLPYSVFYEPDSLFAAIFIWSILCMVLFLRSGSKLWFFVAAGMLGVGILVKPIAMFYWPVIALLPFFFWPGKEPLSRRIGWIAAGLALQLSILSPWILRNYRDFGSPVLSSITGVNLFRENYRLMLEDMDPIHARAIQEKAVADASAAAGSSWANPVTQSQILGAIASREIKAHWPSYLLMTMKRHPRLYIGTGALALVRLLGDSAGVEALEAWQNHPSINGGGQLPLPLLLLQTTSWLILLAAYVSSVAGVIVLIRSREWQPLALTLLTLSYFAIVIGPVAITRYRLPMAPFFSLLAAYGIRGAIAGFHPQQSSNAA